MFFMNWLMLWLLKFIWLISVLVCGSWNICGCGLLGCGCGVMVLILMKLKLSVVRLLMVVLFLLRLVVRLIGLWNVSFIMVCGVLGMWVDSV